MYKTISNTTYKLFFVGIIALTISKFATRTEINVEHEITFNPTTEQTR